MRIRIGARDVVAIVVLLCAVAAVGAFHVGPPPVQRVQVITTPSGSWLCGPAFIMAPMYGAGSAIAGPKPWQLRSFGYGVMQSRLAFAWFTPGLTVGNPNWIQCRPLSATPSTRVFPSHSWGP